MIFNPLMMKKTKVPNLMMFFFSVLFCLSCQDMDLAITGKCGSSKLVKKVNKQKGIFHYNTHFNRYTISVSEPNTYDSVDVGLICNAPTLKSLPTVSPDGLPVVFSGKYRESEELSPIAGTTFYELEIDKIEFIE